MAISVWPVGLPQKPLQNSYTEALANAQLRSDMDVGTKVRDKGYSLPDTMTVQYILTEDQYQALRTFYKNVLANGAKAFDYPHPITGDYVRAGIVPDDNGVIQRSNTSPYAKGFCLVTLNLEIFTMIEV